MHTPVLTQGSYFPQNNTKWPPEQETSNNQSIHVKGNTHTNLSHIYMSPPWRTQRGQVAMSAADQQWRSTIHTYIWCYAYILLASCTSIPILLRGSWASLQPVRKCMYKCANCMNGLGCNLTLQASLKCVKRYLKIAFLHVPTTLNPCPHYTKTVEPLYTRHRGGTQFAVLYVYPVSPTAFATHQFIAHALFFQYSAISKSNWWVH